MEQGPGVPHHNLASDRAAAGRKHVAHKREVSVVRAGQAAASQDDSGVPSGRRIMGALIQGILVQAYRVASILRSRAADPALPVTADRSWKPT